MRYHSLALAPESPPDCLEVSATAVDDGEIMGIATSSSPSKASSSIPIHHDPRRQADFAEFLRIPRIQESEARIQKVDPAVHLNLGY
jgi:hypothetical protein